MNFPMILNENFRVMLKNKIIVKMDLKTGETVLTGIQKFSGDLPNGDRICYRELTQASVTKIKKLIFL